MSKCFKNISINFLLTFLFLFSLISINTQAATVSCSQLIVKQASNGNWYAYNKSNNQIASNYTGIASNDYGWWRIEKGKVNFNANGVYDNDYGWWKVTNGAVDFNYWGLAQNDYGWWRIENGQVNFNAYGVYQNEWGWWCVQGGAVQFNYTGLAQNEYGWWRIDNGCVNFNYNGLTVNEYGNWVVQNGGVNFDYYGPGKWNGHIYIVTGGNAQNLPNYVNSPYAPVNGNQPYFSKNEYTTRAFENYSSLDNLGRCGVAYANVCREIMPTEERGEIGSVRPTGFALAKYDFVDGKYLYNRCHLIGFQLAGENANNKNLITGTRYLNVKGMLPFENEVANYVKNTGNHVLYRVTPLFEGNELVARGVLMEAYSVEDNGKGIRFNVYCFNIQPGVGIDYATGNSWDDGTMTGQPADPVIDPNITYSYVINKNTGKIHRADCSSVKNMNESNKIYTNDLSAYTGDKYSKCKNCNP